MSNCFLLNTYFGTMGEFLEENAPMLILPVTGEWHLISPQVLVKLCIGLRCTLYWFKVYNIMIR